MAAAQPWWDDTITNPHSADDGVDMGTPDNTPLSFPEAGQVIDASYHVYGGQVVVHMPEGYDEYWIHLNKIMVQPGEMIQPFQEIGTSGGGVGDLLLKDGTVQPATSQSDYQGHSSGYHSEIGLFEDTSATGDMNQFNQGWGNPSRQLDPTAGVQALATAAPAAGASGTTVQGQPLFDGPWDPSWWLNHGGAKIIAPIANGVQTITDPSKWPGAIAAGLGFSSVGNAMSRLAAGVAGIGLVFIGLATIVHGSPPNPVEIVRQTSAKAGKAAGEVGAMAV